MSALLTLQAKGVQWHPGVTWPWPGGPKIEEQPPEIVLSRDGRFFYLHGFGLLDRRPQCWLAVDPGDWEGPGSPGYKGMQVLPFVFWGLKSGKRHPLRLDDPIHQELARRYREASDWPKDYTPGIAAVASWEATEGGVTLPQTVGLSAGDWLLQTTTGQCFRLTEAERRDYGWEIADLLEGKTS